MFSKNLFAVVFIHFISLGDCLCPRRNPCDPSPCDLNATCNIMEKSFKCECNEGYSGDGLTCEATIPPPYYNLCDVGVECCDDVTCCTGVPEPGNACTSDGECSPDGSKVCDQGRCRCDASSGYYVDASGQCVSGCGTYGNTYSYYPDTTGSTSSILNELETYYYPAAETCLTECLNNGTCNAVTFLNLHISVPDSGFGDACTPYRCVLYQLSDTIVPSVVPGYFLYVRNCA